MEKNTRNCNKKFICYFQFYWLLLLDVAAGCYRQRECEKLAESRPAILHWVVVEVTIRRRWNGKKSGKGKFNFLHIFSFHFVSFLINWRLLNLNCFVFFVLYLGPGISGFISCFLILLLECSPMRKEKRIQAARWVTSTTGWRKENCYWNGDILRWS